MSEGRLLLEIERLEVENEALRNRMDMLDRMKDALASELAEAREHSDWLEKASTMALRWEQGRLPPSDSC